MTTTKEPAKYAICATRHYYGPKTTKTRLTDQAGREWTGSRAEARQMISTLDHFVYETAHNESARPDYSIVRA